MVSSGIPFFSFLTSFNEITFFITEFIFREAYSVFQQKLLAVIFFMILKFFKSKWMQEEEKKMCRKSFQQKCKLTPFPLKSFKFT